jgi:hypothetical protein
MQSERQRVVALVSYSTLHSAFRTLHWMFSPHALRHLPEHEGDALAEKFLAASLGRAVGLPQGVDRRYRYRCHTGHHGVHRCGPPRNLWPRADEARSSRERAASHPGHRPGRRVGRRAEWEKTVETGSSPRNRTIGRARSQPNEGILANLARPHYGGKRNFALCAAARRRFSARGTSHGRARPCRASHRAWHGRSRPPRAPGRNRG